jgi:hypothetical protein
MTLLRTIKSELNRAVCSWRFYVAIALPVVLFAVSGIDEFLQLWNALNQDVFGFVTFLVEMGSFSAMLILAASFPHSSAYCDDVRHQYARLMLARCGKPRNYCVAKIATGAVTGGIAASAGLLLFILVLRLKFPFVIPDAGLVQSYIFNREWNYGGELLYNEMYIGFFAAYVFAAFCFGAMCGSIGIAVSGVIPNPFVAMFTPFLLIRAIEIIPLQSITQEIYILRPRHILNGNYNYGGIAGSLAYAALFTLVIIVFCYAVFSICMKRRLRQV